MNKLFGIFRNQGNNQGSENSSPITYKLGALMLAVLLWFYVTSTQNPLEQRTFSGLAWTAYDLAADLVIVSGTPDLQVSVTLSGAGHALNNIDRGDIVVYSDLSALGPGTTELPVRVELRTDLANMLQVSRISINSVTVELERVQTAEFMVYVDVIGEVAADFVAMEATNNPTIVSLSGAERYLNRVNRVTATANIEGLAENYLERLTVNVWDAAGNNINNMMRTLPTVEVAVLIMPARATDFERVLPIRLSLVNEPALGYIISNESIEPQTVTVFGDRALLESLNYIATEEIDLANLRTDFMRSVNLVVENAITLSRNQVYVGLRIEPIISRTFEKNLILSINEPDGMNIEIIQQPVQVMISGPSSLIESLQDSDITPFIDLSDISTGAFSLPIRVALPANVTLETIAPTAVVVNVSEEASDADGESANL